MLKFTLVLLLSTIVMSTVWLIDSYRQPNYAVVKATKGQVTYIDNYIQYDTISVDSAYVELKTMQSRPTQQDYDYQIIEQKDIVSQIKEVATYLVGLGNALFGMILLARKAFAKRLTN